MTYATRQQAQVEADRMNALRRTGERVTWAPVKVKDHGNTYWQVRAF